MLIVIQSFVMHSWGLHEKHRYRISSFSSVSNLTLWEAQGVKLEEGALDKSMRSALQPTACGLPLAVPKQPVMDGIGGRRHPNS